MIARISILIFALILLPDIYLNRAYLRTPATKARRRRMLWLVPDALLCIYTAALCTCRDFAPQCQTWLFVYLFLLGVVAAPKFVFVLFALVGHAAERVFRPRHHIAAPLGIAFAVLTAAAAIWGGLIGPRQFSVKRVEISFSDLPKEFDGYRIVHITDLHLGSLPHSIAARAADSIAAIAPDAVVMTGDIQNMQPSEIPPFYKELKRIKAKDGVFAVLGNHDYSMYINAPKDEKAANEARTRSEEASMGWHLLLNGHITLHRGTDSLVIAGAENEGRPPFPHKADMARTLHNVGPSAFVVMLQHDPWAWHHTILPRTKAQLTLSGHTHGGQMSIFGLRPTMLKGSPDCGLYLDHGRALYVSSGLGGFVPFRLGLSPEMVVITLRRAPSAHTQQ